MENFYLGQNTKNLLDRISNCEFFNGCTMWVNMEIFTRINTGVYPNVFQPYSYNYLYDDKVVSNFIVDN